MNITVGPSHAAPNGASGEPTVSGDNRSVRIVAFSSYASNLVRTDANGARDVFVWRRPKSIKRPGAGTLALASVGNRGVAANADSFSPSVDGSMARHPHCVAFASRATNLSPYDALPDIDIYVRDLRKHRTRLVSAAAPADASNPSIAGNCGKVLFESAGQVWLAGVRSGKARSLGPGSEPSFSRDGLTMTWVGPDGRIVFRHGRMRKVLTAGSSPRVSDRAGADGWAVAYNSGGNVDLGIIRNSGSKSVRTAAHDAVVGGVTAYAAQRGIIVFGSSVGLYYLNRHTGNSDDLAYSNAPITQIDSSARANLIAFTAPGGHGFVDLPGNTTPSIYVKVLPK